MAYWSQVPRLSCINATITTTCNEISFTKTCEVCRNKLCLFFNIICAKIVDPSILDKLQNDLVKTLCMFEQYFPPSFFDIMIHLTMQLVRELKVCRPVYLSWTYPFERYMKTLKGYVRNRNRSETCIVESYIA